MSEIILGVVFIWAASAALVAALCLEDIKLFFNERPISWGHVIAFILLLPGLLSLYAVLFCLAVIIAAFLWICNKPVKK